MVCDRPDFELILPEKKRGVENGHIEINSSGYGSTVGGSMTIFSPGYGMMTECLPRDFHSVYLVERICLPRPRALVDVLVNLLPAVLGRSV